MPTHQMEVRGFLDHHLLDTIHKLGLREVGLRQAESLLDLRMKLRSELQHALFLTEDAIEDLRAMCLPRHSPLLQELTEVRTFLRNLLGEYADHSFFPPARLREIHCELQLFALLCPEATHPVNRLARWLRSF
ncbi:MAG: hypothetical protein PHE68_05430 [Candidatus Peribacteraceae bacterium]|nr:hypothetical protein [Candidatus Peribacteraceae bacterium]MDD5074487.1 hypothetical protein [Candidatus Peribacteraceae bacterium]